MSEETKAKSNQRSITVDVKSDVNKSDASTKNENTKRVNKKKSYTACCFSKIAVDSSSESDPETHVKQTKNED